MKIHEDLVFDARSGNILGYVNTGSINSKLRAFEAHMTGKTNENEVATHMLALCVRGIFIDLEYPIAQFPTTGTVDFT